MPPLTQGEDIKALVKKPPSEWPTRSKVQCKHENLIQTDVSYMDKSLVQEPVTVELNRKKVLPETVVVAFESCQLSSFCFDWCWAAVVEWLSSVVDVIQNDCCQLLSEWLLSVVVPSLPGDAALGAAALFGGHGGLQYSRRSGDSSSKLSGSKLYS